MLPRNRCKQTCILLDSMKMPKAKLKTKGSETNIVGDQPSKSIGRFSADKARELFANLESNSYSDGLIYGDSDW